MSIAVPADYFCGSDIVQTLRDRIKAFLGLFGHLRTTIHFCGQENCHLLLVTGVLAQHISLQSIFLGKSNGWKN